MKRLQHNLALFLAILGGGVVFLILTFLLVPSSELQRLAARGLASQGLTLTAADFGKAFPIGISARKLTLAGEKGTLISFDRLSVRLRLLPLLAGRVVIAGKGNIGAGTLHGELELTRTGGVEIDGQGIRLEDIPFFSTVADTRAKGNLWLRGSVRGTGGKAKGNLQLEVKDLDLRGVKISGIPLPDAGYKKLQGMLRIAGGRLTLDSVTLDGEELYVRLSGNLPVGVAPAAAPLNLTVEMMPKPEFMEHQKFVFLLLTKYLTTPGHYQLPIRGTLAKPELQ